ncbi:MAG: hypothetical protein IJ324_11515 [Lachnospiraceae bacterium]|nr:hypothetical protein [Lachnospiraceae bacterium]
MKKLGKLLLFGAAVGTAAAAAYHYFQKQEKEAVGTAPETDEDEAYFDEEDFDDELDITALEQIEDSDEDDFFDDPTPDTDTQDMATSAPAPNFSPLAETLMQEEDVEEFFDDDSDDISED